MPSSMNWVDGAAGGTPVSAANLNKLAVINDVGTAGTPTGDAVRAALVPQSVRGIAVQVVAGDNSSATRAANTTALNAACTAAVAAGHARILLPAGTIHYGTGGTDSGIVIPHGINAVEIVGNALGPLNDGFTGSTLSYWGTGAAIQLDADNGHAIDANDYDGVEGFGLTHVALVYGGAATTALGNGKGNYGTGTYGIRDWRGGRIVLDRAYIAQFEWGVWGVQSDENTAVEGKIKRCRIGYYIGPRSDQFLMQSFEFYFCDTAVVIDGAHQTRLHGNQFVNCGSATTPAVKIGTSVTRPTVGTVVDTCWFEQLLGVSCPSFIDIGVGDAVAALDVSVIYPYINTNNLGSGQPHVASFVRVGNAIHTLIAEPSMQFNTLMEQLVEFTGATPASPDLTIRAHDQDQFNYITSGTQNPVVHWDLRTAAGGKGIGGPIQMYSLTAGKRRWQIQLANTETGSSDTGSDFQLAAYHDDGSFSSNFLTMTRGGTLNLANFVNLAMGTTQGTKIATGSTQKIGFWGATPIVRPTITGSRGGNAALASLLTALASTGLIVDSTTA